VLPDRGKYNSYAKKKKNTWRLDSKINCTDLVAFELQGIQLGEVAKDIGRHGGDHVVGQNQ